MPKIEIMPLKVRSAPKFFIGASASGLYEFPLAKMACALEE